MTVNNNKTLDIGIENTEPLDERSGKNDTQIIDTLDVWAEILHIDKEKLKELFYELSSPYVKFNNEDGTGCRDCSWEYPIKTDLYRLIARHISKALDIENIHIKLYDAALNEGDNTNMGFNSDNLVNLWYIGVSLGLSDNEILIPFRGDKNTTTDFNYRRLKSEHLYGHPAHEWEGPKELTNQKVHFSWGIWAPLLSPAIVSRKSVYDVLHEGTFSERWDDKTEYEIAAEECVRCWIPLLKDIKLLKETGKISLELELRKKMIELEEQRNSLLWKILSLQDDWEIDFDTFKEQVFDFEVSRKPEQEKEIYWWGANVFNWIELNDPISDLEKITNIRKFFDEMLNWNEDSMQKSLDIIICESERKVDFLEKSIDQLKGIVDSEVNILDVSKKAKVPLFKRLQVIAWLRPEEDHIWNARRRIINNVKDIEVFNTRTLYKDMWKFNDKLVKFLTNNCDPAHDYTPVREESVGNIVYSRTNNFCYKIESWTDIFCWEEQDYWRVTDEFGLKIVDDKKLKRMYSIIEWFDK